MTTNGHGGSASPFLPVRSGTPTVAPADAAPGSGAAVPGGALPDENAPADDALIEAKRRFRREALARRRAAHAAAGAAAAKAVRAVFAAAVPLPPGPAAVPGRSAVVAGYAAIRDELDVLPLLAGLHAAGIACALPLVTARGAPLSFRAWAPGTALLPGAFGVPEPDAAAPLLRPTLLLVPLLAFDRAGRRIGYGAGFYDRTLAALRADGGAVAVGIGYAAQEWPAVPAGPHDARLDWIVTEREAIRIAPPGRAAAPPSPRNENEAAEGS